MAGGGAAGGGAAGGAAGGGAGGVGGAGGLAGAGGAGGSLCGNGKRDEGEACDSGPQGDETCTGDCAIRCEAASGEGLVDPVTRHCYLLFRTLVSWEGARMRCGALPGGARLVSFDDEHEFEFLAQELVATFNLDQRIWTGGNDLETEGTYVWEGGGSLASQGFPWNESAGEPNNFNGNQDCAAADDASGFLMYDRGCDDTYAYLCERPGPPLAPGRAARGPDRRPRSTLPPRSRSSNLDASS